LERRVNVCAERTQDPVQGVQYGDHPRAVDPAFEDRLCSEKLLSPIVGAYLDRSDDDQAVERSHGLDPEETDGRAACDDGPHGRGGRFSTCPQVPFEGPGTHPLSPVENVSPFQLHHDVSFSSRAWLLTKPYEPNPLPLRTDRAAFAGV
jgi:hypothetical protein